jgi:hypothetical protein
MTGYTSSTMEKSADQVLSGWTGDQQEIVRGLIGKYGLPDEYTENLFVWRNRDRWSEIAADRFSTPHAFPFQHDDSIECSTPYRVPDGKVMELAQFDGSVTVRRTQGLLCARCHDEQANFLALNLAHDIARGAIDVDEARQRYVQVMIDYRRGAPTPYMDALQFPARTGTRDPDTSLITGAELQTAASRGR